MRQCRVDRDHQIESRHQSCRVGKVGHLVHRIPQLGRRRDLETLGGGAALLQSDQCDTGQAEQRQKMRQRHAAPAVDGRCCRLVRARRAGPDQTDAGTSQMREARTPALHRRRLRVQIGNVGGDGAAQQCGGAHQRQMGFERRQVGAGRHRSLHARHRRQQSSENR